MGIFSWGIARFYDSVMLRAENACLGQWRQNLLASLSGKVLEIGAGTGMNLKYYPDTITSLTLTEPDRHMRARLEKKLDGETRSHQLVDASAEDLPFNDNSFDAAITTLVLCSVAQPDRCLTELRRILKPGGKLILLEHVVDPERGQIYKWQKRIEPFWTCCAGNCHLTRDTLQSLQQNGFTTANVHRDTMRGAVSFVSPVIHGIAEKR